MLLAQMPIAVIMQRRPACHPWAEDSWAVRAVVPDPHSPEVEARPPMAAGERFFVAGLTLELYPDENDGYFENWAAPEPKVFVMWRMHGPQAMPVLASVSYGEGTRMLDSGENADGVAMHREIHAWLANYLHAHYRPTGKRKHG